MERVDAQRPSTWRKFKPGLCDGCWGGCCTLPVEVSIPDLIRLELITEEEAMCLGPKAIAKKLEKQKVIQAFQSKTGVFTLTQIHGRDCLFLDSNRLCKVYEKRPTVCRQFPKIGPKPGYCPHSLKQKR